MTTTHHNGDYIYEMEGIVLPFNKYDRDMDNTFYYYKRQTPKQQVVIKHEPNMPTEIDIYEDPRYHDIDTDEEIDMDDEEAFGHVDNANNDGDGHGSGHGPDLLSKLTSYLESIPTIFPALIPSVPRRLTKKQRRRPGRHTKHANKARPRSSY
jgi:hypothetical protein